MTDIVWQDPPPNDWGGRNSGKGRTQLFVEALKEHPDKWAVYPTLQGKSIGVYRQKFPDVEWTVRKRPDGRVDVYARYRGDT